MHSGGVAEVVDHLGLEGVIVLGNVGIIDAGRCEKLRGRLGRRPKGQNDGLGNDEGLNPQVRIENELDVGLLFLEGGNAVQKGRGVLDGGNVGNTRLFPQLLEHISSALGKERIEQIAVVAGSRCRAAHVGDKVDALRVGGVDDDQDRPLDAAVGAHRRKARGLHAVGRHDEHVHHAAERGGHVLELLHRRQRIVGVGLVDGKNAGLDGISGGAVSVLPRAEKGAADGDFGIFGRGLEPGGIIQNLGKGVFGVPDADSEKVGAA